MDQQDPIKMKERKRERKKERKKPHKTYFKLILTTNAQTLALKN
jgi:hypothetical protein